MADNHEVLANFLATVISVVSEGTSDDYARVMIKRFLLKNEREYFFVQHVELDSLSTDPKKIKIKPEINDIVPEKVGELINKITDTLFSDLFKHLMKRKMDPRLIEELSVMGVKF